MPTPTPTGPVPSPGLIYPCAFGGHLYILSRVNDQCDVWHAIPSDAAPRHLGLHTVAQFWEMVA